MRREGAQAGCGIGDGFEKQIFQGWADQLHSANDQPGAAESVEDGLNAGGIGLADSEDGSVEFAPGLIGKLSARGLAGGWGAAIECAGKYGGDRGPGGGFQLEEIELSGHG